jgi:hypothetical protein
MGKPAAGAMPSAPCTVTYETADGSFRNGPFRADNTLAQGMTHHNDNSTHAKLAGCQGHQVISTEHDTNVNRNQIWTFHTGNGRTSLEGLTNAVSGIMINRIPLDDTEQMVGFSNDSGLCNHKGNTLVTQNVNHTMTDAKKDALCPYGTFIPLNCADGLYACAYPKREGVLRDQVKSAVKPDMINRVCHKTENLDFSIGGDELCAHHQEGKAIAIEYCETGDNFTSDTVVCTPDGLSKAGGYGDLLKWYCGKAGNIKTAKCDVTINANDNKLARTDYDTLAEKYCKTATGRGDPWCGCHNITTGVCDAHPTAAGCAKKKQTFDKLVAATPKDQQNLWSGMEACFGRVCTGTGVFIPPNTNQNCDKSINVCIQDIDIGSMTDSNFEAKCDIKSGDGSPSVSEPSAAQDSAKSELEEAKAALARGDAGAQERVDAAEAALAAADESAGEPISLTDFRTNPKSYIPKSLDGLKNDRKQQIGAGVMGALVLGCMMMLLLLVVSASGGGGGPVKRRFR